MIQDLLNRAEELLADEGTGHLPQVQQGLQTFEAAARDAGHEGLARGARTLVRLLQVTQWAAAESDPALAELASATADFVRETVPALRRAAGGERQAELHLDASIQSACRQWEDFLDLVPDTDPLDPVETLVAESSAGEQPAEALPEPVAAPTDDQLQRILSALAAPEPADDTPSPSGPSSPPREEAGAPERTPPSPPPPDTRPREAPPSLASRIAPSPAIRHPGAEAPTPAPTRSAADIPAELIEPFLDDAQRCLAAIEQTALVMQADGPNGQLVRQVCRELHTLKGASASVGLEDLAHRLHQEEDRIQRDGDANASPNAGALLALVDEIRTAIGAFGHRKPAPAAGTVEPAQGAAAPAPSSWWSGSTGDGEESLRVRASKLDRLMDMLAELVTLRNRQESDLARLKALSEQLGQCVSRLRTLSQSAACELGPVVSPDDASQPGGATPLGELSKDAFAITRSLRDLHTAASEDNIAIASVIRQFRQELTDLRRVPISGLYRRLQRAILDAARVENKQVHVELEGEHTGLERSLQERLYEPLLHIVRNAVCHGVESEAIRRSSGKPPAGHIVLRAQTSTNMLVLSVSDDGRGLDYDALRRRGIERGLLAADYPASREELARLIFQPGFSTRAGTNAVAGRGVGMDVVATTLDRLRGWVDIHSDPGRGSTIQLVIPLRSNIEHTMICRSAGQLFALPMQFIRRASRSDERPEESARMAGSDDPIVSFAELLSLPSPRGPGNDLIVVGVDRQPLAGGEGPSPYAPPTDHSGSRLGLLVDEILGPEEVVVRPLPPLLRRQRLFSAMTLSGSGEIVLLIDCQRLLERREAQRRFHAQRPSGGHGPLPPADHAHPPLLVVDDSHSARCAMAAILRRRGFGVVEAHDGEEALALLASQPFLGVFSDLEMPGIGGLELLRRLPGLGLRELPPVVVVTSRGEDEFRRRAREAGALAYLTKPAGEESVAEVLGRLVSLKTT